MQKIFMFVVLIILIVFLICLFSINNKVKSKENMSHVKSKNIKDMRHDILIRSCYDGGGGEEFGERMIAYKWTSPDACVLEFGGGAGSVSHVVQDRINNMTNHVVIQPKEGGGFGGLEQLKKNRETCELKFQIIDRVLERGDEAFVLKLVTKPFDTIIADCEDCLYYEYKKNPKLFENVKQIQVERDDFKTLSYDLLRKELNMEVIDEGLGCDGACTTEVWVKK